MVVWMAGQTDKNKDRWLDGLTDGWKYVVEKQEWFLDNFGNLI